MKKVIAFLIAIFPAILYSQTYFASASTPADNGSNATSVVGVTPPGSMAAGDLVVLIGQTRTTATTADMNDLGGQTWQSSNLQINTTSLTARVFWCRFNGTWTGADPSIFFGSAVNTTVSMHVFRPGTATNTWGLDQAGATDAFAAPGSPFTMTRTGQTTVSNNVVALFMFLTVDDNTMLKSAGTATVVSSNQYRNTAGNGQAHGAWYEVFAASGTPTGDLSARQSALGGDAGCSVILLFKEYTPTNRGIPFGQF